jgi:hypothetical protein
MGETLRKRFGPLPVWAWALAFVVVVAIYLIYRKNQANAAAAAAAAQQGSSASSNLGTVPVSNLTTEAQPMPIQMGDTFVNTTVPNTVNVNPWGGPPSSHLQTALPPALALKIGQAQQAQATKAAGGSVLKALTNEGLSSAQIRSLSTTNPVAQNFLTENMVNQEAGLGYWTAGNVWHPPTASYSGVPL